MPAPPTNADDLLVRATALGGHTLGALAQQLGVALPRDTLHGKGFAGELIERALGCTSGSSPGPDFPELGIELKTLPIGAAGRPCESTHVCAAPLGAQAASTWSTSPVCRKLARVLWVPIDGDRVLPLGERRIGRALLWSPTAAQARRLQQDWEELMELVVLGRTDEITAAYGECLQLRPKAAHGRARTRGSNAAGEAVAVLPRGFYLRARFTAEILRDAAFQCAGTLPRPRA